MKLEVLVEGSLTTLYKLKLKVLTQLVPLIHEKSIIFLYEELMITLTL
jgi:hypothetical protein